MAEEKICPILDRETITERVGMGMFHDQVVPRLCIGDKCAWWVESAYQGFEGCAVLATAVYSIWEYNDKEG